MRRLAGIHRAVDVAAADSPAATRERLGTPASGSCGFYLRCRAAIAATVNRPKSSETAVVGSGTDSSPTPSPQWAARMAASASLTLPSWPRFSATVLLPRPLRLPPPQVDHPHHGHPGQQGKAARLGHRLFADALAPVGGEDGGVGVVDVAVAFARRDGPFRPGRSPWQERKQATSPRGLMAWLVFDCGRDSRRPCYSRGRYAFRRRK